MASGRTHGKVNLLASTALVATALYLEWQPSQLMALGLGCAVSTLFLSPDLDLRHSLSSRSWGILRAIWIPYHRIFRHRGMSHWPLVGTLTRLIYLWAVVELLSHLVFVHYQWYQQGDLVLALVHTNDWIFQQKQDLVLHLDQYRAEFLAFLCGLLLIDIFHSLIDWLSSAYKWLRA